MSIRSIPLLASRTIRGALTVVFVFILCAVPVDARAQDPFTLTGSLEIGLSTGTLVGDFCLHQPPHGDTTRIVLNRSLSILRTRGATLVPELTIDEPGGFAKRYSLVRTEDDSSDALCLAYAGSEPVYDVRREMYREDDSSYVIAFNGSSVRARGAARWYPAIFDTELGTLTEAESFRVTVLCEECRWIYLNGVEPRPGPLASFESSTLREPYLLAGNFPVTSVDGNYLIGQAAPADSLSDFFEVLTQIRAFEEEFIGVPFERSLIVTQPDAVAAPREGRLWGFYSDPALTLIGMSASQFVDVLHGPVEPSRHAVIGFLAHELAHRYFGWGLGWKSPQRDLFGEPFATYIEYKAIRHFLGEAPYERAVQSLVARVSRQEATVPLDLAGPTQLSVDSYRYSYAPLQLFALESIIGEPLTRAFLRGLVTAPEAERASADFDFMRRVALDVGVSAEDWGRWMDDCLRPEDGESGCLVLRTGELAD